MTTPVPKCLRCGGDMQQGYIGDRTLGGYDPTKWFEGELAIGKLGGIKKAKSAPFLVSTYRCVKCGYLESYAAEANS
jgi:hypothetical protein